ncbi:hypothetical protein SH2C18_13650 [Clostridium sediminicola]|uniref:SHOCT domain-containing protein n=1 Tax=Clostridium sediminicola TaxID=3114879 RepID=UPI0031F26982
MMWNRGFYGNGGCFGYGNFGVWHYLMMGGVILLIVALFIWALSKKKSSTSNQALYLLNIKYAQGEVSEEEYLNRKRVLNRK